MCAFVYLVHVRVWFCYLCRGLCVHMFSWDYLCDLWYLRWCLLSRSCHHSNGSGESGPDSGWRLRIPVQFSVYVCIYGRGFVCGHSVLWEPMRVFSSGCLVRLTFVSLLLCLYWVLEIIKKVNKSQCNTDSPQVYINELNSQLMLKIHLYSE